jgi:hypothetical protein
MVLLGVRGVRRDVARGLAPLLVIGRGLVLLVGRNRAQLVGTALILVVTHIGIPDRLSWYSSPTFIVDGVVDQCHQPGRVSSAKGTWAIGFFLLLA